MVKQCVWEKELLSQNSHVVNNGIPAGPGHRSCKSMLKAPLCGEFVSVSLGISFLGPLLTTFVLSTREQRRPKVLQVLACRITRNE